MTGLTNSQQATLTFLATLFIAFSTVSIPAQAPWYVTFSLALVGVLGLTLKEFLGSIPISPSSTNNQTSANSSSTTEGVVTVRSSPSATLPSLPQGFSLAAAKSAGFTVYENAQGNIILASGSPTIYTDAYGNRLQDVNLQGYTQL